MIVVRKRRARDAHKASVSRLELGIEIALAVLQFELVPDFCEKRRIELLHLSGSLRIGGMTGGFGKKAPTFQTGPGTNAERFGLDVSESGESLQCWIHPAIQGNVARAHEPRPIKRLDFLTFLGLVESAVPSHVSVTVVRMSAIHLSSRIPPERGADNDIGREVFLTGPARCAYSPGRAVGEQLG